MNEPVPLKLDAIKDNHQLAMEYLIKNDCIFRSFGLAAGCNTAKYVFDDYNNKIFYTDPKYFEKHIHTHKCENCTDKPGKMRELAKKIKENSELFGQLESLIRRKSCDQVQCSDIKLIVHNLLYWSAQTESTNMSNTHIIMAEETPLAMLGIVAQLLMNNKFDKMDPPQYITIGASKNTAAVCYLFTELCHQVGLTHVCTIILEDLRQCYLKELNGCTGVITNHSDTDSAVDAFLASTTKYPWILRRILIQESVYESVKKILEWKCNLKSAKDADNAHLNEKIKTMCSFVFVYGKKKFLLDYAGKTADIEAENQQMVLVEAYRTPKELISLLTEYDPFYLSLWSSDIAEANEIAFEARAAIVWVNDYGTFDGPWKASQAFYSIIQMKMSRRIGRMFKNPKLDTLREAWLKVDYHKRVEIVKKAVESYVNTEKDMCQESLDFVNKLRNFLSDCWNPKTGDLIDIQKGKICIVINDSIELIAISDEISSSTYCNDYVDVMKSLIAGNAVSIIDCKYSGLFKLLIERGLPVLFARDRIQESEDQASDRYMNRTALGRSCCLTKVVYKNFGTIFAN